MDDVPDYMTLEEVAAAARLDKRTLYNRIYRGQQPRPVKICGRLRFPRADVLQWLKGEPVESKAEAS